MAILVAALGSFYAGAIADFSPEYLQANLSSKYAGGELIPASFLPSRRASAPGLDRTMPRVDIPRVDIVVRLDENEGNAKFARGTQNRV